MQQYFGTKWIIVGSISAAAAVGIGAFGAHGLEGAITGLVDAPKKSLEYWETGCRYQIYHSIGIILVGLCSRVFGRSLFLNLAASLFVVGITFFSGLLYVLACTDFKILGAIVPLGGLAFIAGWVTVAIGMVFNKPDRSEEALR